MAKKSKRRLALACPCCSGEVHHRRYGFNVLAHTNPRFSTFYVCDACETALSGDDPIARAAAEEAFLAHLEVIHAPTAQ